MSDSKNLPTKTRNAQRHLLRYKIKRDIILDHEVDAALILG